MLHNYLKIAIKVLLRRKFFTAISLFGIGFTLTVLLVVVGDGRQPARAVGSRGEPGPHPPRLRHREEAKTRRRAGST